MSTEMSIKNREEQADDIIKKYSLFSTGAALIPIPGLDVAANTLVQVGLVRELCALYQVPFNDNLAQAVIGSVMTAGGSRLIIEGLTELAKTVPAFQAFTGNLTAAALAGMVTAESGQVYKMHFDAGGTLEDLGINNFFNHIQTQLREGKFDPSRFATMRGQFAYLL